MCVNVLKLVACSFILGSFGRGWFPALSKYEHVVKENPRNICIFGGGGANFRGKLEKALRINFMVLKNL